RALESAPRSLCRGVEVEMGAPAVPHTGTVVALTQRGEPIPRGQAQWLDPICPGLVHSTVGELARLHHCSLPRSPRSNILRNDTLTTIGAQSRTWIRQRRAVLHSSRTLDRATAAAAASPGYSSRRTAAQRVSSCREESWSLRSTAETWVSTV